MGKVRAGAGKERIRIPERVFPHENYTREESPIHVRVLVLDYGERTAIVSLEMPSVRDAEDMDCLKRCVSETTETKEASIWLCTTHDLCTMHIPPRSMPEKHDLFLESLLCALRTACLEAMETLQPVKIGIGAGTCDINTSRDVRTNQGWWNGINGVSREDKRLTVFRFENLAGKPVGLLYHYPVKCCTVQSAFYEDGTRVSSSELAGVSSGRIEEALGAPALFFMGAAADMVPKKYAIYCEADEDGNLREINLGVDQGLAIKNELGKELADCVLKTNAGIQCSENMRLAQGQTVYRYPGQKFYNEGKPYHPTPNYVYYPAEDEELEVTALALGDTLLLGMAPEVTATIGLTLREKYAPICPLLVALVNGGKDYLADELSYDRYTYSGTHSVFAKGGAERFVEDVAELIAKLYQDK